MNDWCSGDTLENDVTKTYEEKTEVRACDEADGTIMGLKNLKVKQVIWLDTMSSWFWGARPFG